MPCPSEKSALKFFFCVKDHKKVTKPKLKIFINMKWWILNNIGWHWGLYENILHASWWWARWVSSWQVHYILIQPGIKPSSPVQYYYYIIWSWLYSEILTIIIYTMYSTWCKFTSRITVINIAYRSHQDQTSLCWLTNSFLANYCCTYVTTIVNPRPTKPFFL